MKVARRQQYSSSAIKETSRWLFSTACNNRFTSDLEEKVAAKWPKGKAGKTLRMKKWATAPWGQQLPGWCSTAQWFETQVPGYTQYSQRIKHVLKLQWRLWSSKWAQTTSHTQISLQSTQNSSAQDACKYNLSNSEKKKMEKVHFEKKKYTTT